MRTKSIWGNPPTRIYKLIKIAEKDFNNQFSTCIVGCSDGKFLMPFARKGHKVVGYDIDDIAIYGGEKEFPIIDKKIKYKYSKNFKSKHYKLDKRKVVGVTERLKIENIQEFATIEKRDFYKTNNKEKFDVVFTSCSLHYSINQEFTLIDKTKKIQDIVNDNGLLYIDYMMAIDENDYETYPKNKFYRKGEIVNYFDNNWEVISYRENNFPSFEGAHMDCVIDHFHRFGYIFAKKIGEKNAK